MILVSDWHWNIMEYTNERINKESEAESLGYFLEAYETIIGESFTSVKSYERPDFHSYQKRW